MRRVKRKAWFMGHGHRHGAAQADRIASIFRQIGEVTARGPVLGPVLGPQATQ